MQVFAILDTHEANACDKYRGLCWYHIIHTPHTHILRNSIVKLKFRSEIGLLQSMGIKYLVKLLVTYALDKPIKYIMIAKKLRYL